LLQTAIQMASPAEESAGTNMGAVALAAVGDEGKSGFEVGMHIMGTATTAASGIANTRHNWMCWVCVELLAGIIYYLLIVSKYPKLPDPFMWPAGDPALQKKDPVSATCDSATGPICLQSFCFGAPRAAHTFHVVGVFNYWVGLPLMTFLPCCTLFYATAYTDLKDLLGGGKSDKLCTCLCAMCCPCCMIAQDAVALDMLTGARTRYCYVDVQAF